MPTIKLTRRAIKDLKRLSEQTGLLKVPDLLADLQQRVRKYDICPLDGNNEGLQRSKHDRLRLIFQDESADVVIKAVKLRDDRTYKHNYNSLSALPRYEWHGEQGGDWLRFVTGSYRYSPILTEAQRSDLSRTDWHQGKCSISLIQNPPGTGKTLTALLRACEYYQENKDIIFIVPRPLIQDLEKFKPYQNLDRNQPNRFFLGTFWEWIAELYPERKIATVEEELIAFRQVFKQRRNKKNSHQNNQPISHKDVLLYQAFVLNQSKIRQDKNPIYRDNLERIEYLRESVNPFAWYAALGEKLSRWQATQQIQNNQLQPIANCTSPEGVFIFVDEAQDYLLSELKTLFHLGRTWNISHPVQLWLFGDLNQRIQPVNFTWGNLELEEVEVLEPRWQNFRNSKRILEFANLFLQLKARLSYASGTKWSAIPGDPELAYEEGDSVRLIVYNSKQEAYYFLEQLQQKTCTDRSLDQSINSNRSLLQELSRQVKVLVSDAADPHYQSTQEVEFLTVEQVKGREFESSIAFCLFDAQPLSQGQIYQWYTLFTRTRSRLLIVATRQEIEAIGAHYFSDCQIIEPHDAIAIHQTIQWIASAISDADAAERVEYVKRQILKSFEQPLQLYWDMYDILRSIGLSGEDLRCFEEAHQLIETLRAHPLEELEREQIAARSTRIPTISLQCLILRSMHRSWDAVAVASQLIGTDDAEYQRILQCIAADLEQKGLFYEAERVRAKFVETETEYPYPELLNGSGKLLPLIYDALSDRLSYLEEREIALLESSPDC
ncbi:hypothetical protein C7B76_08885 [filamentous cyanobacterium CCP2]|nr:hypothetical protein C7B76_08885 [filamentous cyanobacterium CCP2]